MKETPIFLTEKTKIPPLSIPHMPIVESLENHNEQISPFKESS